MKPGSIHGAAVFLHTVAAKAAEIEALLQEQRRGELQRGEGEQWRAAAAGGGRERGGEGEGGTAAEDASKRGGTQRATGLEQLEGSTLDSSDVKEAAGFRAALAAAVESIADDDPHSCLEAATAVYDTMLRSSCPEIKVLAQGIMWASQAAADPLLSPSFAHDHLEATQNLLMQMAVPSNDLVDLGEGQAKKEQSLPAADEAAKDLAILEAEADAEAEVEAAGVKEVRLEEVGAATTRAEGERRLADGDVDQLPTGRGEELTIITVTSSSSSYSSFEDETSSSFTSFSSQAIVSSSASTSTSLPLANQPESTFFKPPSASTAIPSFASAASRVPFSFSIAPKAPSSSLLKIISSLAPGSERARSPGPTAPAFKTVPIFFATNRNRTTSGRPSRMFGTSRSRRVHYGVNWLSMPNVKKLMPRTNKKDNGLWQFEETRKGASNERIVGVQITPISIGSFFDVVSQAVEMGPEDTALVYVHGFNTPMHRACQRLAQVVSAADFRGVAVCFSWPSNESLSKYTADDANCSASIKYFTEFLRDIRSSPGIRRVQILAHSMGSRLVLNSLLRLPPADAPQDGRQGSLLSVQASLSERTGSDGQPKASIGQVVLAAPDFDLDEFTLATADLAQRCRHITVYTSAEDQALIFSRSIHGGYPRLGDSDGISSIPLPSFGDFVDIIDTTDQDLSILAHNYVFETSTVLSDCGQVLCYEKAVSERPYLEENLFPNGLPYWTFHNRSGSSRLALRSLNTIRKGVGGAYPFALREKLQRTLGTLGEGKSSNNDVQESMGDEAEKASMEERRDSFAEDMSEEAEEEKACSNIADVMKRASFEREEGSLMIHDDSQNEESADAKGHWFVPWKDLSEFSILKRSV